MSWSVVMPRFFLDTNILIDAIAPERNDHEQAQEFVKKALVRSDVELFLLNSCLKDLYFIVSRHYGGEIVAREAVRLTRDFATSVELSNRFIDCALVSDELDFEDGIMRAAAESVGADFLVTRDKPAFKGSLVRHGDAAQAISFLDAHSMS